MNINNMLSLVFRGVQKLICLLERDLRSRFRFIKLNLAEYKLTKISSLFPFVIKSLKLIFPFCFLLTVH